MRVHSIALAALLAAALPVQAAEGDEYAGFRFHVGVHLATGLADLRDKIEQNNPQVDIKQLTVAGLAFSAYYMLPSGLGIGGSIGPAYAASGDASYSIVPLSAGVRYAFVRDDKMAAYAGAAVEKQFVNGDFIDNGSTGAALTAGLEFSKPRGLGWGLELGYHTASVTVKATPVRAEQKAHPGRVQIGAFFLF